MDLERGARLTRYSPTAEAGLTPLDWCSLLRRPHHHVSGEAGYARNPKQRIIDPCQRAKHRQVSGETVGPEDSIVPHLNILKMLAYDRERGLTRRLLRMTEPCTPSPLIPDPPPRPLPEMTLFSIKAPEMIPSPPSPRPPLRWMPHWRLSRRTLPRMTGRSPLLLT